MERNRRKITVKGHDRRGFPQAIHMARIDRDLADQWYNMSECNYDTMFDKISLWSDKQFGIVPKSRLISDVVEFRSCLVQAIKQTFKETPQELLSRGILSYWIAERMREEINTCIRTKS